MISRRQFLRGQFANRIPDGSGQQRPFFGEACLARSNVVCRACGDACEAAAIRFQPRLGGAALPEVDGEKCTGCGDCVSPCPVAAITLT